jgi:hypothetical protein
LSRFTQVRPRRSPAPALGFRTGVVEDRHDSGKGNNTSPTHNSGNGSGGGGSPSSDAHKRVNRRRSTVTDPGQAVVATPSSSSSSLAAEAQRELFSLHLTTRGLLNQPKTLVNARVVVVGASNTAISFLETLLMQPELHYSHLTLVSPVGLPNGRDADFVADPSGVESFPQQFLQSSLCK